MSMKRRARKPDIISDLPEETIELILSRLPIRDAARTSVLSTKWRYRWASLPFLEFNYLTFPLLKTHPVWIIDQILMLHIGPIQKFSLCLPSVGADDSVDRWILWLSRCSVKGIRLKFGTWKTYKVPSCLFSCQSLASLSLQSCLIGTPPSAFEGFKNLKRIEFAFVKMAKDAIENMISGSPMLEWLSLREVNVEPSLDDNSYLKIKAPNLRDFIGHLHRNVIFENTTCLTAITIRGAKDVSVQNRATGNSGNLIEFFNRLPKLQSLKIDYEYLLHLSTGIDLRKLPRPCYDLDRLSIALHFNNEEVSPTALTILSIAPNLRKLVVRHTDLLWSDIIRGPPANFWKDCRGRVFNMLQRVDVLHFCGSKPELDFIKFLLSSSPSLERLTCYIRKKRHICDDTDEPELVKKDVLSLRRFSNTAEISCLCENNYI